jgi:hypothetical protein
MPKGYLNDFKKTGKRKSNGCYFLKRTVNVCRQNTILNSRTTSTTNKQKTKTKQKNKKQKKKQNKTKQTKKK